MVDELERDRERPPKRSRRERARTYGVAALGALASAFALLNLDTVRVDLLIDTVSIPLVVVVAACLLIGIGIGTLAARMAGRRERG